jgi:hypothetical protein
VIGKRDRGKYRPQRLCANASGSDPAEVREGEAIEIVSAKAVERHQQQGRLRKVFGPIDAAASR